MYTTNPCTCECTSTQYVYMHYKPRSQIRQIEKWQSLYCSTVHVHLYMYSISKPQNACTCITVYLRVTFSYGYKILRF